MPITGNRARKSFKRTVTNEETITKKGRKWGIKYEHTEVRSISTITLDEANDDYFKYDVSNSRLWATIRGRTLAPPPKGFLKNVIAYKNGDYEGGDPGGYIAKGAKLWKSKRVQTLLSNGKNFVAAVKRKAKKLRDDRCGVKKYGS